MGSVDLMLMARWLFEGPKAFLDVVVRCLQRAILGLKRRFPT
jgi:hypothetical protein